MRIDAAARIGFGTRNVEIPGRAVTFVRGVAVLAVPKEAVVLLPSVDVLGTVTDQSVRAVPDTPLVLIAFDGRAPVHRLRIRAELPIWLPMPFKPGPQ